VEDKTGREAVQIRQLSKKGGLRDSGGKGRGCQNRKGVKNE